MNKIKSSVNKNIKIKPSQLYKKPQTEVLNRNKKKYKNFFFILVVINNNQKIYRKIKKNKVIYKFK